jgi:NTE family protein
VGAVLTGMFLPGGPGRRLASAYARHLFGNLTLQDLPDRPRFVFNATNLQSGVLWRFSKPYMRDYKVGEVRDPTVPLSTVVAASSAFPPFLSPVVLRLRENDFTFGSGQSALRAPFRTRVVLSDGGCYDNLGLETALKRYKTVLVSDGGGRPRMQARPWHNWFGQSLRVMNVIDSQVRALRKRELIDLYQSEGILKREGAYWGIWMDVADYGASTPLVCPTARTKELAELRTRLQRLPPVLQERLINWGYAACDVATRTWYRRDIRPAGRFPYPDAAV